MGRKKPATVFLSEEDFQKLVEYCSETERSISSLLREIVKAWLKEQEGSA